MKVFFSLLSGVYRAQIRFSLREMKLLKKRRLNWVKFREFFRFIITFDRNFGENIPKLLKFLRG